MKSVDLSSPNPLEKLLQLIKQNELWEGERILQRNEYLKMDGTKDSRLYYIISGSLRVFVFDPDTDEEHTIRFGYQNNIITDLSSFITDAPSDFNIQALRQTHLRLISKNSYMQLINSSKETQQLWQQLLGQLIYQQMEREVDILTSSPKVRYQRVLARSPQLFQEIPSKYIAAYLRMTPETLSRLKKG